MIEVTVESWDDLAAAAHIIVEQLMELTSEELRGVH